MDTGNAECQVGSPQVEIGSHYLFDPSKDNFRSIYTSPKSRRERQFHCTKRERREAKRAMKSKFKKQYPLCTYSQSWVYIRTIKIRNFVHNNPIDMKISLDRGT